MLTQYDDVLTVSELQEALQIGRNAAYALLQSGEIGSFRVGRKYRIPKSSVIEYLGRWTSAQP